MLPARTIIAAVSAFLTRAMAVLSSACVATLANARLARTPAIRMTVACLSLLVAFGSSLPAFARLLGGPAVHVCHCEARSGHGAHEHCGCPICVPELRDVDNLGHAEVKGACGDDEPGVRKLSTPAIAVAGFVLAPPLDDVVEALPPRLEPSQWLSQPELPPPRRRRVSS